MSKATGTATATKSAPADYANATGDEGVDYLSKIDIFVLDQYRIDEIAEVFPLMSPTELAALAANIAAYGQREPITRHDGRIIDGRNRLVAAHAAGVTPRFEEWTPNGEDDSPLAYVWSKNGPRRHLTPSQKAILAARLVIATAKERRERQERLRARTGIFSDPDASTDLPVAAAPHKPTATPFAVDTADDSDGNASGPRGSAGGREREKAAKALQVSTGYVNDALALVKNHPDVADRIASGGITMREGTREIVAKAVEDGTPLEETGLRPRVAAEVLASLDRAKFPSAKDGGKKPRMTLKKFGTVSSSKVTVIVTATFGNTAAAEEYLNKMNDDPRVTEMSFAQQEPKPAKRTSARKAS